MKTIKIKMTAKSPGLKQLIAFLNGVAPGGDVLNKVMKRVMINGILRSVRQQFLSRQNNAYRVELQEQASLIERSKDTVQAVRQRAALEKAYAQLDSAVLSGKAPRIGAANERIRKAEMRMRSRGLTTKNSRLTQARNQRETNLAALTGRLRLGAIVSSLMRSRVLQVLRSLTDPQSVSQPVMNGQIVMIGAASQIRLDFYETPTATVLLSGGRRSTSPHKILWKHLEFGTGVRRSKGIVKALGQAPKDTNFSKSGGSWLYGSPGASGEGGMRVIGTLPMHFLWTAQGESHPAHLMAALRELDEAMQDALPKLK